PGPAPASGPAPVQAVGRRLVVFHWGWVTPGVLPGNRRLQLDGYLRFVENQPADTLFNTTQPGWLFDRELAPWVLEVTRAHPDPMRRTTPASEAQVERFAALVAAGKLVYVAYPYSGAVVEGMAGEAVLRSLRLTRRIAASALGAASEGFLVHDGPTFLDWNAPQVVQIGRLAGFGWVLGCGCARVRSADGSVLPVLGPHGSEEQGRWLVRETPHAPPFMDGVREALHGEEVAFASLNALARQLPEDAPARPATCRTKGWYGGTPDVLAAQAHLRRVDRKLPMLAAMRHRTDLSPAQIDDIWKASLILQDCHYQWLYHDAAAHLRRAAADLERRVDAHVAGLAGDGDGDRQAAVVFNPLPFERAGVVERHGEYRLVDRVPAMAAAAVVACDQPDVHATTDELANDRLRVKLGAHGEIIEARNEVGHTIYRGSAGLVRHFVNVPCEETFALRTGEHWARRVSGNLVLECEVDVPAAGSYTFTLDTPVGLPILLVRGDGGWASACNLHWGGGLPSANRDPQHTGTGTITLPRGKQRLRLHALADCGFMLAEATLRQGENVVRPAHWQAKLTSRWEEEPFHIERRRVVGRGHRAWVEMEGRFSTCCAVLRVGLTQGSRRIDCSLSRTFDQPTREGFRTDPLPLEVASYLGAGCERPYAPPFTIETTLAAADARYTTDKPYGYDDAVAGAECWPTASSRAFFDGLTPLLGIDTAIAETPRGSVLMLTDGHGHFFRREEADAERLGLSLGASAIHPMTQGYRIPETSPWYALGRQNNGHDFADGVSDGDLALQRGRYDVSWSLLIDEAPMISRASAHRHRLDRLMPLQPAGAPVQAPLRLSGEDVVLEAFERDGDRALLRVVNLASEARVMHCAFERPIASASVSAAMDVSQLTVEADALRAAVR
ncbi:MAG: hypothetical protein ACODAQ_13075, partial [Phycisphaeraceae bacterium]